MIGFEQGNSLKRDHENMFFHLWHIDYGGGLAFED